MRLRTLRLHAGPRLRRWGAGIGAALAAVLLLGFIGASPAFADSSATLPGTGGHTCLGSGTSVDKTYQAVFCADLGIYTNSQGQQYVTLQAEAYCQYYDGEPQTCPDTGVSGTVANGSGYTDWTFKDCDGNCVANGRNYLFPFGGLPISPGVCDANVWGVIETASSVTLPDGVIVEVENANLETAHYNVCEESNGAIEYQ
jgi:hypothetical protein